MPKHFMGKAMFSSTVSRSSRLKCWKIMPTFLRNRRRSRSESLPTSVPLTSSLPSSNDSRPLMQHKSVDFPAPLMPTKP